MTEEIKRLLELALKAMADKPGFEHPMLFNEDDGKGWYVKLAKGVYWRPQHDDGDSRRLEVALGMLVEIDWDARKAFAIGDGKTAEQMEEWLFTEQIPEGSDGMAETRLVVLRAAAAIGEAMP